MLRGIDKWFWGYLKSVRRRPGHVDGMRHVMVCVADHFEPYWNKVSKEVAMDRVRKWVDEYPKAFGAKNQSEHPTSNIQHRTSNHGSIEGFRDADGKTPQHTFFYPQEEYDPDCIDMLAGLCSQGYGEVEIHLHHRNDTVEGLRSKVEGFKRKLSEEHGLLGKDRDGNVRYGFIHGNWSLCNSRPDGDWCGVNEELGVLRETGCYADFTFPSAPSPTQPRMVNAIYRARDIPGRPRSHDHGELVVVQGSDHPRSRLRGRSRYGAAKARAGEPEFTEERVSCGSMRPAQAGQQETIGSSSQASLQKRSDCAPAVPRCGTHTATSPLTHFNSVDPNLRVSVPPWFEFSSPSLMLITGPLGLNWKRRKLGILPRLENAEISKKNPPTADRIDLWVKQGIHVLGKPEWVFVKLHTHGCVPGNSETILGDAGLRMHEHLAEKYNDGKTWMLHYVTAREMYNVVRAAEDGQDGEPGQYRDYEIGGA